MLQFDVKCTVSHKVAPKRIKGKNGAEWVILTVVAQDGSEVGRAMGELWLNALEADAFRLHAGDGFSVAMKLDDFKGSIIPGTYVEAKKT